MILKRLAPILLLIVACSPAGDDSRETIAWVEDYQQGIQLANETGKPAMVFFTADWCPPCRELKRNVFSSSEVVEASRRLINIYVDADKSPETLRANFVNEIPTIFFIAPQGDKIKTLKGVQSVGVFLDHMQALSRAHPGG
jgi:protein disulfide-isomerase